MNFLAILLFSASVTCDNLIIGLSYGARKIKICFLSNLIVGLISCLGTLGGMYIGNLFDGFCVGSIAQYIGSALLFLFGIYMFYQSFRKHLKTKNDREILDDAANVAEQFDMDHSKSIDLREACMLGFFLCINNFGLGIGAALTGLNIYLTSITCLILSIFFIELGCRLTYNLLSQNTVKYAEYVASIMIILLALYQLIS
ncbi:MAG: sporulation membrane protein YtaF [Turicibacter sp.]|jgi:putative sporulation protein YtaF|uniref:sporulation membrane protein YtaF n=1 Tax=Turicibacter sp. KK003 TaxID=3114695 RepID=UPI0021700E48|nr:sporulation membrane protein YtaF [Turicibacter sp.]